MTYEFKIRQENTIIKTQYIEINQEIYMYIYIYVYIYVYYSNTTK